MESLYLQSIHWLYVSDEKLSGHCQPVVFYMHKQFANGMSKSKMAEVPAK